LVLQIALLIHMRRDDRMLSHTATPRIAPVVLHTVAKSLNTANENFDHIIKITTKKEHRSHPAQVEGDSTIQIPVFPTASKTDEMLCRMKQLAAYFHDDTPEFAGAGPMLDDALSMQAEALKTMRHAYGMYDALAAQAKIAPSFDSSQKPSWKSLPFYVKYTTTRQRDGKKTTLPRIRSPCDWECLFSSNPTLEDYVEEAAADESEKDQQQRGRRMELAWSAACVTQKAIKKHSQHAIEAGWRAAIKDAEFVAEVAATKFHDVTVRLRLASLKEVTARRETLIECQGKLDGLFRRHILVARQLRDIHPYSKTAHLLGGAVAMSSQQGVCRHEIVARFRDQTRDQTGVIIPAVGTEANFAFETFCQKVGRFVSEPITHKDISSSKLTSPVILSFIQIDLDMFMHSELKLKGRKVETTKAEFGARVLFVDDMMRKANVSLQEMEHEARMANNDPQM